MDRNHLRKTIVDVLKTSDVKKASLFGSIVSGEFTSESDIDILIEFDDKNNKSLLDLIELKSLLEEKTNFRIDLLTYDSVAPDMRKYICDCSESIYG